MCRVELKVVSSAVKRALARLRKFLMYRVELKGILLPKESGCMRKLFLMYRVELKGF